MSARYVRVERLDGSATEVLVPKGQDSSKALQILRAHDTAQRTLPAPTARPLVDMYSRPVPRLRPSRADIATTPLTPLHAA